MLTDTWRPVLYNIQVQEHAVHRVMRQFNLYQLSPLPVSYSVPDNVHKYVILYFPIITYIVHA